MNGKSQKRGAGIRVEPRLNEHMIVQNMAVRKVREQLEVVLKEKTSYRGVRVCNEQN